MFKIECYSYLSSPGEIPMTPTYHCWLFVYFENCNFQYKLYQFSPFSHTHIRTKLLSSYSPYFAFVTMSKTRRIYNRLLTQTYASLINFSFKHQSAYYPYTHERFIFDLCLFAGAKFLTNIPSKWKFNLLNNMLTNSKEILTNSFEILKCKMSFYIFWKKLEKIVRIWNQALGFLFEKVQYQEHFLR